MKVSVKDETLGFVLGGEVRTSGTALSTEWHLGKCLLSSQPLLL